jgi:RNA polymerase sigma-70 factor (ECF subfamily)
MAEDELYRRYAVRVNTLCRRYLSDEDDAKDLMLETLIQALDKIDTFKYTGEGSLYAWVRRIAINKALNQIKRHRWRMVSLDFRMQDNIPEPTEEEVAEIPKEKLREWIAELSDMRRAVFNLYCIDGYSHKEIGEMLGISERGSTSTLAKARKELKEKIQQYLKEQD